MIEEDKGSLIHLVYPEVFHASFGYVPLDLFFTTEDEIFIFQILLYFEFSFT